MIYVFGETAAIARLWATLNDHRPKDVRAYGNRSRGAAGARCVAGKDRVVVVGDVSPRIKTILRRSQRRYWPAGGPPIEYVDVCCWVCLRLAQLTRPSPGSSAERAAAS